MGSQQGLGSMVTASFPRETLDMIYLRGFPLGIELSYHMNNFNMPTFKS
jgi:hypothetical protein